MSIERKIEITCPGCGEKGNFTVWQSLNANIDPEAKNQLLEGTLFTYECPHCGEKTTVQYPLLYHDMDKCSMVYLLGSEEEEVLTSMPGFGNSMFDAEFMPEYKNRTVNSQRALLEKVLLLENGLDDRLVELCKAVSLGQLEEQGYHVRELYFAERTEEGFTICCFTEDGGMGTVNVPMSVYDQMAKDFSFEPTKEFLRIDTNWAFEKFNEFAEKH